MKYRIKWIDEKQGTSGTADFMDLPLEFLQTAVKESNVRYPGTKCIVIDENNQEVKTNDVHC